MHMPGKKSLQTEHHPPWGKKNTTGENQPLPGVSGGPGSASVSALYAPGKQSALREVRFSLLCFALETFGLKPWPSVNARWE